MYFIAVGVLYLWGYWPTFGVNILEYAGLTDIIKTAAYPIASLFAFFALGAVLGEFLAHEDALPPGGGVHTPAGRIFRRIAPYLAVAYLAGTLLLFVFGPDEKWRILPVLVTLPIYFVGRRYRVLSDLVANDNVRSILIFLLSALPFFAYGHGRLKAAEIVSGYEFSFSSTPIPRISMGNEPVERRPRYLGVAGGKAFFYVPEHRSTIVVEMGELKVLELSRHISVTKENGNVGASEKRSSPSDLARDAVPARAASQ